MDHKQISQAAAQYVNACAAVETLEQKRDQVARSLAEIEDQLQATKRARDDAYESAFGGRPVESGTASSDRPAELG